jgi:hypothetical protein
VELRPVGEPPDQVDRRLQVVHGVDGGLGGTGIEQVRLDQLDRLRGEPLALRLDDPGRGDVVA